MSKFAVLTRLAALAFIALSWPRGGEFAWLRFAPVALGALTLLRVPRSRLLLELAVYALAWAWWKHASEPLWLAGASLLVAGFGPRLYRLNGVDRYFVAQDRPGAPMNSHHFVETKEPFERAALTRAVSAFQRDVPIAATYVHEAFLGVERFRAWHPLFGRPLRFVERPLRPEDLDARFDLLREPPFRVLVAPREGGGFVLVLTVHHSAADGTAGFLLLARLLQRYDEHRTNAREQPLPRDPAPRRFRELLAPKGKKWLLAQIRRHVKPLDKMGVANASLLDDETPQPVTSRHQLLALPLERWEALKEKGAASGLTRNDLLLAAALRAADKWRQARNKPDRNFRVLFPTDLRPLLGLPPCVQNFVGVIRSDFTIDEVRSDDLPRRVQERVKEAKTLEEAIETPVNLGVLSVVLPPWAFRIALRTFDEDARSFFFSFLWSNVRIPPDLKLPPGTERVWIRGSLVRQPGFGVVVSADGLQLNVALEYLVPLASDAGVKDYGSLLLAELS